MEKIPMYDENGKLNTKAAEIPNLTEHDDVMQEMGFDDDDKTALILYLESGFKWPWPYDCGAFNRRGLLQAEADAWLKFIRKNGAYISPDRGNRAYYNKCLPAIINHENYKVIEKIRPLAEIAKKFDHAKPVKSQIKSFAAKRKKELKKIKGMTNNAANRTISLELEKIPEFAEYLDSQKKTSIKKLLQI